MPNPDYKKMFGDLAPHNPEPGDLDKLATIMSGRVRSFNTEKISVKFNLTETSPIPKIPAGYTYLSQFIAHDISFDEKSDRHRREDFPDGIINEESLNQLRNLRKPSLNLEVIYGRETWASSRKIDRSLLIKGVDALPLFKLGVTGGFEEGSASISYPNDLPRGNASIEAKIADPRNDENLLLAQTQVAFMKFHNAMVVALKETGNYSYEELLDKARKLTIRYYQTIILTDFLPRVVQRSVLEETVGRITASWSFYRPDMFIPLEFSVAAYRFGHSMIRNRYDLNVKNKNIDLFRLMFFTGKGGMNSTSDDPIIKLSSIWILDWNLFYELNRSDLNFAEQIDTELSVSLLSLFPPTLHNTGGRSNALAVLDLYRGRRFGLPSGQDIASKLGVPKLSLDQIAHLINSKKIFDSSEVEIRETKERLCEVFSDQTPLWFYVLAEAEIQSAAGSPEDKGKLGDVGSRIVAETFVQLIYDSEYSILRHEWESDECFLLKCGIKFGMPDMLKFIQKTSDEHFEKVYPKTHYKIRNKFDELNPLGNG